MNKKSKFIAIGGGAILLGALLFHFGNEESYSSATSDTLSTIFGVFLFVAGVASVGFGIATKKD